MQKIRAILVDDEESARDVLKNLLSRFCPEVEVLDTCANVPEAVEAIKQFGPDVVFLDIEMPKYAGFELVRFFQQVDFDIIFVTAYDQYALRAFEMAAVDYLLKPVDITRLKQAVARVSQQQEMKERVKRMELLSRSLEEKKLKNIVVNDKGQQQVLALDGIVAIEAQESYCLLHAGERKHVVSRNLKHFENLLEDQPQFLRVHKSWIINTQHILHYSKAELLINMTGGVVAKLSKYQKADFEAAIRS